MSTVTLHSGIMHYVAPACSVIHVTDDTLGNRVVLGQSSWFAKVDAIDKARELSLTVPVPQRAIVLGFDGEYLGSWQCGERMPSFWIVE